MAYVMASKMTGSPAKGHGHAKIGASPRLAPRSSAPNQEYTTNISNTSYMFLKRTWERERTLG